MDIIFFVVVGRKSTFLSLVAAGVLTACSETGGPPTENTELDPTVVGRTHIIRKDSNAGETGGPNPGLPGSQDPQNPVQGPSPLPDPRPEGPAVPNTLLSARLVRLTAVQLENSLISVLAQNGLGPGSLGDKTVPFSSDSRGGGIQHQPQRPIDFGCPRRRSV